jgi:hypothetical protein
MNVQLVNDWIQKEGINTIFFSLKKYPILFENIINMSYNYLDD